MTAAGDYAVTPPAFAQSGDAVFPLTEAPPAVTVNDVPVTDILIRGVVTTGSNALTLGVSAVKKSPP